MHQPAAAERLQPYSYPTFASLLIAYNIHCNIQCITIYVHIENKCAPALSMLLLPQLWWPFLSSRGMRICVFGTDALRLGHKAAHPKPQAVPPLDVAAARLLVVTQTVSSVGCGGARPEKNIHSLKIC